MTLLFAQTFYGICPEGHTTVLDPSNELWQEAFEKVLHGEEGPLSIKKDDCDLCISQWLIIR